MLSQIGYKTGKEYRMIIRPAHVEDAPAMGRVMVDTYLTAHHDQMPEEAWQQRKMEWTYDVSASGWARTIAKINEGNYTECIYVAVAEAGEVVGLAMGHPAATAPIWEIGSLYVCKQYQGQGLGRQLVGAVAAHLATTGTKTLHIATADG